MTRWFETDKMAAFGEADVTEKRIDRRLVAILAADVAGYSRLTGIDEEGTVSRLRTLRFELIDPLIAANGGRIVKLMGDGSLVEFRSVVDAVRCAVEVQKAIAERNDGTVPERRIALRIGIHVGDVIEEAHGDLMGDGVNIAARLEGIAEPGAIYLSNAAYEQVRDKVREPFTDLGDRELKNIMRPVHVYRLELGAPSIEPPTEAPKPALALPDRPSIAVLPFDNMSGDIDQDYFCDGVVEDIITALSRLKWLFVIARNSSFAYKSRAVDVRKIGHELGVRYLLEGSVRKIGGRVRITAQLVDGLTGGHLWAERYDRALRDIFEVQDEVGREIVAALAVTLTPTERENLARRQTVNLEAYELYLRGRELAYSFTKTTNLEAISAFRQAIAADPRFAAAQAMLGYCMIVNAINRWGDPQEKAIEQALQIAEQAALLDASEPRAQFVLGIAYLWLRKHDRAVAAEAEAIRLEPNFADAYAAMGQILVYSGRPSAAIEQLHLAMRFDPHYPNLVLHSLGLAYFLLKRYEDAITAVRSRLLRNPGSDASRVLLASCYGHLGRKEEACREWNEALTRNPNYSWDHARNVLPYRNPSDFEQIVEGARKAGLPA
jgi:adenylate cyclase